MPDRIQALRQAVQARHEQTLRRAEAALNSLDRRGEPVTVRGVADAARVSRSWIYQQPRLLAEIDRLRQPRPDKQRAVPTSQKATIDSLRQQLHAYRDEITRLRAEIASLREQLARQLGAARTAAITSRICNVLDMSTTPKP
jgi:chromosome segregation ATPase